ncbi:MAG TPA: hypothetical protein VIH40_11745 [Xanthobacteraceae bacterium]
MNTLRAIHDRGIWRRMVEGPAWPVSTPPRFLRELVDADAGNGKIIQRLFALAWRAVRHFVGLDRRQNPFGVGQQPAGVGLLAQQQDQNNFNRHQAAGQLDAVIVERPFFHFTPLFRLNKASVKRRHRHDKPGGKRGQRRRA